MPPHIPDHRDRGNTHMSRGSDGAASIVSNYAPSITVPTTSGTTLAEFDSEADQLKARGQADQLDTLNAQLQVENRIKEGAENLLQMPLDESLRLQVEEELDMARSKINAITKKIATHNARGARRAMNGTEPQKRKFNGTPLQSLPKAKADIEERDDFRTALQQASSYIRTLHKLVPHRSTLSPPTSPSSSTTPSTLPEVDISHMRVDAMNQLTNVLQRNLRVRYEVNIPDVVQAITPALADSATKHSRATAYRLMRHMLVNPQSVERLQEQSLDWYIVRSLARDAKHAVEKEQVIKLIRAIVEIGSSRRGPGAAVGCGTCPLSEAVMRAFMAVAEHPDEPFKLVCLQTLTEILLIDVALVARTGGIRLLLHALSEGPVELSPIISSAFLYIADSPRTRAYLRPGTDLEMALSGITDAYGKGAEHVDKMRATIKIVASMLRTWSGLLYFCVHDKLALRAVVDGLRIPSLQTREVILDMFFDLFNIKPPEWHQAFIDGRRLTMYRRTRRPVEPKPTEPPHKQQDALKLTEQYVGLLILVFNSAGLMDALTAMLEETAVPDEEEGEVTANESSIHRKATLLIAEILQTANRVLPLSIAAKIQALPRVFSLAAAYDEGVNRTVGTSTLSAIESYNRHRMRLNPIAVMKEGTRPRANSVEDAIRRGQKQAEQSKIKLGLQMDDKTFQTLLLDSQVMTTKDQTKWNFDVLQDLMEGPFLNPKRMEEAIKVSRYVRKLISFYHPFSHRFSDLAKSKSNVRWVRLGCMLLNALLASPEGTRFLAEDEFLSQIVNCFAQLDPSNMNMIHPQEALLSKRRITDTLSFGYLEMLGVLSKRREGIELLERFKLFTAFYHVTELSDREDLIKAMIENLDYTIDGHSRIVLAKALTSSHQVIRLMATNHLGGIIRDNIQVQSSSWALRLLLTQMYDAEPIVQETSVRYLEEACESPDVLQMVVEMHPTLEHLGDIGNPLLLKFMSNSLGFRYLYAADYIDREMDAWFHERNLHYVVHIEVFLAKAFGFMPSEIEEDPLVETILPPHFYGVMAKTELGCQVLQEKGHFSEFASFIRKHRFESEDQDLILKLKSVLWAVGNIGSTERGLPFLEEEEIIPAILEIAEQSLVLSVRGTCFFVLGLISSTPQGAEILDDYHWEATLSPLGFPTGMCVPSNVDRLVSIPPWEPIADIGDDEVRLESPVSEEENEVLTAIYNLANTVIANAASRTLARMRSRDKYKRIFSSTSMLYRALHAISSQRYRLPVRRYILDLFNLELNDQVVHELTEHAVKLRVKAPPGDATAKAPRVVSVTARPPRHRRISESDEESMSDNDDPPEDQKYPVIKARPQSQIIGF